jgi:hypothetical protein
MGLPVQTGFNAFPPGGKTTCPETGIPVASKRLEFGELLLLFTHGKIQGRYITAR